MKWFFLIAALSTLPVIAQEPKRFASGPARVALVELYTSEGCSSCPPAERWIAARQDDAGLWRDFVPVAFHVDYWNQLGWRDRFSTRDFTQRQYALAEAWGNGSVYTPCFVRDGAEWRPTDSRDRRTDGKAASPGALTIVIGDGKVVAEFAPSPVAPSAKNRADNFELTLALLGGGLVSKVTAGENSGSTLRQEFVALTLAKHALAAKTGGPNGAGSGSGANETDGANEATSYRAEFPLPTVAVKETPRALAAWVTRRGELAPVQATGGWLK